MVFVLKNLVACVYFACSFSTVWAHPATHVYRQSARVVSSCTEPNTVALTFDDGPWEFLAEISDTLSNANVKGTFFFNGQNFGCIYDESLSSKIQYAYSKGHQIGSHTWSHAHLPSLSSGEIESEFSKVDDALRKIVGVVPAFVRPPYGEHDSKVDDIAGQRGQTLVIWDFDSGDSAEGATADKCIAAYDDKITEHPSNILTLNHEVKEFTAHEVLPHAIEALQDADYNLVSLSECLGGDKPYKSVADPSPRDDTWTC